MTDGQKDTNSKIHNKQKTERLKDREVERQKLKMP